MPVYTYLLQLLPRGGGNWATLREPRTGAPVDGTLGTVEVPEAELPDVARDVMNPYSGTGLKARVSFWEGRRVNDKLYSSETFCMIHDNGSIVDAKTILQDASDETMRHFENMRLGCPHAPHDGSCGHEGSCMFAHHGRECEAVRLVCPACFEEERPAVVSDIVSRIQRDGDLVLRCSSCERLSFQFDAELVCYTCQWLVPQVNEELEDRFAGNGGDFAPSSGSCVGCGQQMPHPTGPFSFGCPMCGWSVNLILDSLPAGSHVVTMCSNKDCKEYIQIPPSIWCQECGQNLRSVTVILKLTLEANDIQLAARSNVRDDEAMRLARRLAVAAESSNRRFSYLSDEQKQLVLDGEFLDSIALSIDTPEEWIRDVVEIRAAGHELNRKGGMRAMLEVHQRVLELGLNFRNAARHIELYWDGIGNWAK